MTVTVSKEYADRFTIGTRITIIPRRTWIVRLWRRLTRRRDPVYVVSSITGVDSLGRVITVGTPPEAN